MYTTATGTFTFGPDNAGKYGTSSKDYRLWLDYVYDWFHASLEHRFRRYVVSLGLGAIVFLVGLSVAIFFGFSRLYLTTPGIYFFSIGIAWFLGSLRWLSHIYHIQTNVARPCFPIPDAEYKSITAPFARRATRNGVIVWRSLLVSLVFCSYFAVVYFGPVNAKSSLLLGFPGSFSSAWHEGGDLIPKMAVLDIFCIVASFGIYTGAHIMLVTLPLFSKLATLPVIPFPQVINQLFGPVLTVYSTGALMWSFGVVLAELIYNTQLDTIGVTFAILFGTFGLLAFFWPRQAVRRIWSRSSEQFVSAAIGQYYSEISKPLSMSALTRINRLSPGSSVN